MIKLAIFDISDGHRHILGAHSAVVVPHVGEYIICVHFEWKVLKVIHRDIDHIDIEVSR